jgi:hypothetical protein
MIVLLYHKKRTESRDAATSPAGARRGMSETVAMLWSHLRSLITTQDDSAIRGFPPQSIPERETSMIERLVLHRFRGIRQGDLRHLQKFNLFFGPNDSGKTSILELLYLSATSGRPLRVIRDDRLSGGPDVLHATTSVQTDLLGFEPFPFLRRCHGMRGRWGDHAVTIAPEGGLAINLDRLTKSDGMSPWNAFRPAAPLMEEGGQGEEFLRTEDRACIAMITLPHPTTPDAGMIPGAIGESGFGTSDASDPLMPMDAPPISDWHYLWDPDWVYRWDQQHPMDRLAVWVTQGQRPHPRRVAFFDAQAANRHLTDRFLMEFSSSIKDWGTILAERMAQVFPDLTGITIETLDAPDGRTNRTIAVRFPRQTLLPIDHLGDGARSVLPLLAGLTALDETVDDAHPGLLLWDAPETALHAASLYRLFQIVADIAARKPIQVCITTHSLDVLAWWILALERQPRSLPDQFSAFHLTLKNGQLYARPFRAQALGSWLDFFGDPRLIAEDESDSPLMRMVNRRRRP